MKKKIIKEIIITPIVDITLIVLLFFMIAYSRTSPNFSAQKVEIPSAKNIDNFQRDDKTGEISINSKGVISINNKIIDKQNLKIEISKLKTSGVNKIILKGDKNTTYDSIIEIMDLIKENKIDKIFLAIKPREEKNEPIK
ncbi:MAG TPA: biopolymer transporter ExbD [Spirochaetota bacterium]|nr:biopolymer transporter ExbD [Spirochaetota bacterium]HOM37878.1 biopolymer transporter ExbD [Spirochaetota bacterium]HPQ48682.1 biopolymer transporter ExbD [Spirochaetota bacterium]